LENLDAEVKRQGISSVESFNRAKDWMLRKQRGNQLLLGISQLLDQIEGRKDDGPR
jgi:hypothetical protein